MSIEIKADTGSVDDFVSFLAKEVLKARDKKAEARTVERLLAANEALKVKHSFAVGDLATWKKGLQNYKPTGPFLIVEILSEPFIERDLSNASSFREPQNAVVLFIDGDGDACHMPMNTSRLEPYKAEETEEAPATEA